MMPVRSRGGGVLLGPWEWVVPELTDTSISDLVLRIFLLSDGVEWLELEGLVCPFMAA